MSDQLSRMKHVAISASKGLDKDQHLTITVLKFLISLTIVFLILVNSLGFGLGYSNMKLYHFLKEDIDRRDEIAKISKCFPPFNTTVKVFVPGFQLGCFVADNFNEE